MKMGTRRERWVGGRNRVKEWQRRGRITGDGESDERGGEAETGIETVGTGNIRDGDQNVRTVKGISKTVELNSRDGDQNDRHKR